MGEVFAARDTRLDRLVAVKVLPRALASDPDRRARFEREAKAISALSHPHVCALFDVGRAEGPDGEIEYLVMERLEGETLAARLARGPLPVAEVLVLGVQLAGALAAAHRRGIVHRDLKPGNVMLTRAGAKLLDFGLARHGEGNPVATAEEDVTATLATEAQPLTHVGTLVGTWPYLAPEQVQGRPADARSDVFALGCVLFEALAGRRAFPGGTRAEITAGILGTEPPDLREAAPGTPPALAALVRQCLAKDPDERWQCADDVARGLRLVEEGAARPGAGSRPSSPSSRWALAVGVRRPRRGRGRDRAAARAPPAGRRAPALRGASAGRSPPAATDHGSLVRRLARRSPHRLHGWLGRRVEPVGLVGRGRPGAPARGLGGAASRRSSRPTGARSRSSPETT